ncbi:hypothetical protein [Salinicoccus bachuensis]|uniref:Uncharacterized protein n=1 Tax=Salinicoccus bachuensis TaxID=3136731 RepID=A0ABZ3CIA9_9STAP
MKKGGVIMELIGYISSVFGILGTAYGLFQHFYHNQIKFYFFITKLFNRKKAVKFSVLSRATIDELDIKSLAKSVRDNYTESKKVNSSNNSITINMGDFIASINFDDFPADEFGENFSIECFVTTTNYKNAINTVDDYIDFCKFIKNKLNIDSFMYTLTIDYSKVKNPYLSADIGALKSGYIKKLLCVIDTNFISENNINDEVIISKNKLNFTSKNDIQVYKVAEKFMIV